MLTEAQRSYLLNGPQQYERRQHLYRTFDGPCQVLTAWKRHRDELMSATPMGKRPYAYWMVERRLKHRPVGERGELRAIRTLQAYRDDAERDYVNQRLAELTEVIRSRRNLRRVA